MQSGSDEGQNQGTGHVGWKKPSSRAVGNLTGRGAGQGRVPPSVGSSDPAPRKRALD